MPAIPQYTNKQDVEPSPSGVTALEQAARRVGPLLREGGATIGAGIDADGRDLGNVWQTAEHAITNKDIANGYSSLAQVEGDNQQRINTAANQDPGQFSAFAHDFTTNVLPAAQEKFMAGFSTPAGQQWAAEHWGAYAHHSILTLAAENAHAAGDDVALKIHTATNQYADNAFNAPEALPHILDMVKSGSQGIIDTSNLSPDVRAKLQTGAIQTAQQFVVHQAGMGIIAHSTGDPTAQIDQFVSKYAAQLTPEQQENLRSHASVKAKTLAEQGKADDVTVRRIEDETFGQTVNHLTLSAIQPDGTLALTPDYFKGVADAGMMPGADRHAPQVKAMIDFGKEITKEQQQHLAEPTPDPHTVDDFTKRMFAPSDTAPPLTLAEVFNARASRLLDTKMFNFYREAVSAKTPEDKYAAELIAQTRKEAEKTLAPKDNLGIDIDGAMGAVNAKAETRWLTWFLPAYQAGIKAGHTPAELLSPDSKDYLMNQRPFASFKATGADKLPPPKAGARPSLDSIFGGSR